MRTSIKTLGWICAAAFAALVLFGCQEAPKVAQGTVVSYDAAAKNLVIKDQAPPSSEMAFSLQNAEIGATPQTNDEVRIAYRDQGGQRTAIRVMNLTRQAELGKKAEKK